MGHGGKQVTVGLPRLLLLGHFEKDGISHSLHVVGQHTDLIATIRADGCGQVAVTDGLHLAGERHDGAGLVAIVQKQNRKEQKNGYQNSQNDDGIGTRRQGVVHQRHRMGSVGKQNDVHISVGSRRGGHASLGGDQFIKEGCHIGQLFPRPQLASRDAEMIIRAVEDGEVDRAVATCPCRHGLCVIGGDLLLSHVGGEVTDVAVQSRLYSLQLIMALLEDPQRQGNGHQCKNQYRHGGDQHKAHELHAHGYEALSVGKRLAYDGSTEKGSAALAIQEAQ